MASSLDVARYLIHLAAPSEDEDVDCLCHLRLQKLLYYVQGHHLASRGKPLFSGRIEAWKHGPVVKEVYAVFSGYGCQSIPPKEGADPDSLSEQEKLFIASVWEEYKQYSASALRAMTHREPPWEEARRGFGPQDRCNVEIQADTMRSFFAKALDERVFQSDKRIDKSAWARSGEAIESGRTRTTEEIRRELHRRRAGAD